MKTDTTKLFDDMIAEDVKQESAGLSDSAKIEKTINDAMQKMQALGDKDKCRYRRRK